jgi:glycosyltransferase involved in cell wall biosynthesis
MPNSGAVRVAIVIPALDEEESLPSVLATIPTVLDARVIVADNGSTDRTAEVARQGGAEVIEVPQKGYGSACLAGIKHLDRTEPRPDVVVILDADHADDPGALLDFVGRIERGEADFVLSTRTQGGAEPGSLTAVQYWGNRLQTLVINTRFRTRLTDMGPMRAIRFEPLLNLGMVDPTWGWNVEMACKAARAGLRIVEVPVTYRNRLAGDSKISGNWRGVTRAGTRILWALYTYAR